MNRNIIFFNAHTLDQCKSGRRRFHTTSAVHKSTPTWTTRPHARHAARLMPAEPTPGPYTGPLNTTPYPGCAAALKCVEEQYCTHDGIMSNSPVYMTREQQENRVPLSVSSAGQGRGRQQARGWHACGAGGLPDHWQALAAASSHPALPSVMPREPRELAADRHSLPGTSGSRSRDVVGTWGSPLILGCCRGSIGGNLAKSGQFRWKISQKLNLQEKGRFVDFGIFFYFGIVVHGLF